MEILSESNKFSDWLSYETTGKDVVSFGLEELIDSLPQKINNLGIENIYQESLQSDNEICDMVIVNNHSLHENIKSNQFKKVLQMLKPNGELIIINIDSSALPFSYFINLQSENVTISYVKNIDEKLIVSYKKLVEPIQSNQFKKYLQLLNDLNCYYNNLIDRELNDAKENNRYKELYLEEKSEKINLLKDLHDEYTKREKDLVSYRKLLQNYEYLQNKYNNLRRSKLGKLTSKYWELRRKLSRK